ncbi:anhydro-N-acetylmuramic acid kinase [Phormidesmis priestleyi ULC007]|uniref:Anhydro-N-acetylmuramic acid kinase n=1 Tax=Phormidesmis priestleyi ULC007 TaxID=1920490 RepID=A0A2T1D8W1_9CYAN|nr:anhydro-N-acetylmuramic acid kinase [Phormidesmis priestleyi]PSB16932.1 anhydro-N-acetylmuramic acid kinase [Phormidesmis priestleyi ULC007]PZO47856.1 MAG: anhydro-N-acetylmuramic acid kinase [Phormidesmis priestleyi]
MRVIGLMSGTSVDGIDAALVEISGSIHDLTVQFLAGETYPYPSDLREKILAVCGGAALSMADFAQLDDAIATQFAQAALSIQNGQAIADLIGSHGQTVYHQPPLKKELGYSLQLGRGATIADQTGITTVSNFREADIAIGGHGAPLVPTVDAALLSHPTYSRCVQNIGGIGNVAYLPATSATQPSPMRGWDTGPGNVLLDLAVEHLSQGSRTYDQDGAWAATGEPCQALVDRWLQQDFFQQLPPKSTGREHFGQSYLQTCLIDANAYQLNPAEILATLTELTAASIAHSYRTFLPQMPDQILLCGGGSRNLCLKQRIQSRLSDIPVMTTDEAGLSADFKEAIAFAVLAYWRHRKIPGNSPETTGASKAVLLGEINYARENFRVIA